MGEKEIAGKDPLYSEKKRVELLLHIPQEKGKK